MASKTGLSLPIRMFLVLAGICLLGTLAVFIHSYYLESYFNVHVVNDPRWRIFNFNSRQATEGDIYNVAEIPAVRRASLVGRRRLRLEFTPPIAASSWTVTDAATGAVIARGPYPEVQFGDEPGYLTCKFVPEGVTLLKDIVIKFHFYPTENYKKSGMSWDDNYHAAATSVPWSLRRAHSVAEWAGLPADDPELVEAKRLLEGKVDPAAPALERSEQVYRFIMDGILGHDGARPHTDKLQLASPLETWEAMSSGREGGFCENVALIYYLFGNAAGIPTRLVDIAGKFGPVKLTGHYFCESWIPEAGTWCYVDPQSRIANVRTTGGRLLSFLDLKRACDLGFQEGLTLRKYDRETKTLVDGPAEASTGGYSLGNIVIAYKFGYGRNKSFNKVEDFVSHTTLLYAPFELPQWYLLKFVFLYGFLLSAALAIIFWLAGRMREDRSGTGS